MDITNLPRHILAFLVIFCLQNKGQRSTEAADAVAVVRYSAEAHAYSQGTETETSVKNPPSNEDKLQGRRVVCLVNYHKFPKTDFRPLDIDAEDCTHINYEFATLNSKTYELEFGAPDNDTLKCFLDDMEILKILNPSLKILLSMGGWLDSTVKYSELVSHQEKTEHFIAQVIPLLKDHKFDGLDIAWEFPNCWMGALGIRPSDQKNYGEFLMKVREKFDPEGLLLTIRASAVKREIDGGYDVPTISKAVHFINVMTYDMHGPWEPITGHHAQFDKKDKDPDSFLNMKAAMELWAKLGAERLQLTAGIPTYAKTFTLANPTEHGLGATATGPGKISDSTGEGGFMCYNELCKLLNSGNWTEAEDKQHGYYAFSGDQWASYDPPLMVVRKAKWIAEKGFGGLLYKDVSCDDHEAKCISVASPLMKMGRMEMINALKKMRKKNATSSGIHHTAHH